MATTTSRAARVMTEADRRLQDAGFDGSQSRAVILSAAEIVDEAIREAIRPLATKEDLAETNRRLAIVEGKVAAVGEKVAAVGEKVAAVEEKVAAVGETAAAAREEAAAAHKEAVAAREEAAAAYKEAVAARQEAVAARQEAAAARQEAAAAHKAAAAALEATKGLTGELDRFRDRTTAEMAMGFARMSRQLWVMAVGAVGAAAMITFGIVNLLR